MIMIMNKKNAWEEEEDEKEEDREEEDFLDQTTSKSMFSFRLEK